MLRQSAVREMRGGNPYATYLTGARGPEYRRDASGNVRWYLYDGLGSVLGEVDEYGALTVTRKLDVYGLVRNEWVDQGETPSNHKFVGGLGHTSDGETALIYMRARYVDPALGRFISEDPSRNGTNWYVYCDSDPVNLVDESGKSPAAVLAWIGIALAIFGGAIAAAEALGYDVSPTFKHLAYAFTFAGAALAAGALCGFLVTLLGTTSTAGAGTGFALGMGVAVAIFAIYLFSALALVELMKMMIEDSKEAEQGVA